MRLASTDTIWNHMTDSSGTGIAGSCESSEATLLHASLLTYNYPAFTKYNYPAVPYADDGVRSLHLNEGARD